MKNSLLISLLCGLVFIYTACDEYDDTYPAEYHKIISLKQTGEESMNLYNTGQDASFDITVMKSGYDPSLTAQAKLTVLSDEALKEYNENYTILPSTTYTIEGSEINFQPDELYKISKVVMKTNDIQALVELPDNAGKTFVLPISLVSSTDSVNSMNDLYVVKPVITTPKVTFKISEEECVKGFASETEPALFIIPLGMEIDNQWDFTAKVEIVNNDGEEGYLPSNTVTLENDGVVAFEPGKEASLKVSVSAGSGGDLTNLVIGGKVAIRITEVNGIGFDFDTAEFTLTVTGKEYTYNNKGLDASMLSFNFTAFANGTSDNLFDKDALTFVQTPFPNRGFSETKTHPYFQLTLPEGVTDFALSLTQCHENPVALLRGFDVIWSADGSFTDIPDAKKSYSMDELDAAGAINVGASFTTSACHSAVPVKYIRLVQTWNCEGTTVVGSTERWHFRMAELRLYGVSIQ